MSTATDTASAPGFDVCGPRSTGWVTTGVLVVTLLPFALAARLRRVPTPA
jgi:hypothetical protein